MINDDKADILIAEDQPDNLRLLSNLLQQQGYQVRQAIDGEMALLAVETFTPDLLLLDVKMPCFNGYEVCYRLKAQTNTAQIPIIFLSAFDEVGEKVKAFEAGAVDYITKPYQAQEVLLRVKTQVRLSLLQKQLTRQNSALQQQLRLSQAARNLQAPLPIDAYLLYQAIAATQNGIVICEATQSDYPILYVNPGYERMTGYTLEEVKGKNCRFLQGIDREQPQLKEFRRCLRETKQCCVTLRNYHKDGSLFWNEVSLSPVQDSTGQVAYYIGVLTDVTERIRATNNTQRYEAAVRKMNRELHELNEKLHRLANLDGLTEVANRRCFDDSLKQEWRRLSREEQPLSLILGDIDYFKRYNDTYGHLGGDDCLKAVAKTIAQAVCRPADLVARYGGEEFAILLPNTPASGALQVAQIVLQRVRSLQILHAASDVRPYVTLSLGIVTLIPSALIQPKQLIDAADEALYQAKQQGRDRAVVSPS